MLIPQQAVILAGGRASRLGSLAESTPKPLLPVAGRPFIEYLLDEFARHGFADILLACGRLGEQLVERYDGREWKGATVRCACEPREGGTAGALLMLREQLQDRFALANGDTLFGIDWLKLAGATQDGDAGIAALRAVPAADAARYGSVRLGSSGIIEDFAERPQGAAEGEALINGGAYVLTKQALADAPEPPSSLERDVLPRLAENGKLRGMLFSDAFIDIGVAEDYEIAQTRVKEMAGRRALLWDASAGSYPDAGTARELAAQGAVFLCVDEPRLPDAQKARDALRVEHGARIDGVLAAKSLDEARLALKSTWPLLGPVNWASGQQNAGGS